MVFSSIIFLCFFLPVMIIGYYILPKKLRNLYLVLGSLFFYAFGGPEYVFIMIASIVGNYLFGVLIDRFGLKKHNPDTSLDEDALSKYTLKYQRICKAFEVLAIVYNLGILFYFKYFSFVMETAHDIWGDCITVPQITLPIGISFYTFQGMSYVIDVYRSTLSDDSESLVQKNPLNLALYISMFPQLIAGPIVRYTDIKASLTDRKVSSDDFAKGIERFITGLCKKVIFANTIGEIADKIFTADLNYMGTSVAWIGAVCYTLQIYYDFSGYSDMAIGLGRVFGFKFMENFNFPYISKSITEFWRRWHISLSTWFRDYLYIPLGGNRRGNVYVNLFIVFLATGIWHGAAWGFVIWGLWHGLFMLFERVLRKKNIQIKLPGIIKWAYTMLVVMLGWVLFKLEELSPALEYIGKMFDFKANSYTEFSARYYLDNKAIFIMVLAILAAVPWAQILPRKISSFIASVSLAKTDSAISIVKRIILLLLVAVCLIFIVNSTYNPFIYFRF